MQREKDLISSLLEKMGRTSTAVHIERCSISGNNRAYVVDADDTRILAKFYFRNDADPRDRLSSEWTFLDYAKSLNVDCVPLPLACDREEGLAFYEFIEGRPCQPSDVGKQAVANAAHFFRTINAPGTHAREADLPNASEACFSLRGHLNLVRVRLNRLRNVSPSSDIDRAALSLISEMQFFWDRTETAITKRAADLGISVERAISPQERCISPSDFGFHNAIMRPDGRVAFIDFEYAGWDDPAKMVADFFFQPAVPVDRQYWDFFVGETLERIYDDADEAITRTRLLYPAIGFKWCCIILGVFTPEWIARQAFSEHGNDVEAIKHKRLKAAEELLGVLEVSFQNPEDYGAPIQAVFS